MTEGTYEKGARSREGSVYLTINDEGIIVAVNSNIVDAHQYAFTYSCSRIVEVLIGGWDSVLPRSINSDDFL